MAFNRSAFGGSALQRATQRSQESVNDAGGFHSYLKSSHGRPTVRKIPQGTFVFDIIPFIGTNNFANIQAGEAAYVLDVWAHTNIGPTRDSVICPASTMGQPCPICEERARLEAQGAPQDAIKALKPKRRVVYNVWVHDATHSEENKGVQIMEGAHFSYERNIQAIARHPVTGECIFFADPDQGRTIAFTRTGAGATDTRYDGFQFITRPAPIPDAILQQAVPLENFVEVLSYDELKAKLEGGSVSERLQEPEDVPTYGQAAPTYGQTAPASYGAPYGQAAPTYGQTAPQSAPAYGQPAPAQAQSTPPWSTSPMTPPVQSQPQAQAAPVQAAPVQAAPVQPQPQTQPVQVAPSENPTCPLSDMGGKIGVTFEKFQQCGACNLWDDCSLMYDAQNGAK